jgi:hypothetical protein
MATGKYIPPALRAKMAAEAAETERAAAAAAAGPAAPRDELNAWLREARVGYVAKTPEQIRAECLSMNYEQLRKRAGPPPTICSDDYGGVWEQGGEGEGAHVCTSFDEGLRLFKRGNGPPPAPLQFDGRDDGGWAGDGDGPAVYTGPSKQQKLRAAYSEWWSQWGYRLAYLWQAEKLGNHSTHKKLPPVRRVREEEYKEPTRGQLAAALSAHVSDKSGW